MKQLLFSGLLLFTVTEINAQRIVQSKFGDTLNNNWIGIDLTLSDSVYLSIKGPSILWFALGFNTKHMQRGVDVLMVPAWKESFRELMPFDAVLTGYAPPKRDDMEHWRVVSEEMKDGMRSFVLVRALATGDSNDFDFTNLSKNGGPLDIIWAMGSEKENKTEYHGNQKGKRTLTF